MGDAALTAAADAINALATALQPGREQTLITIELFKGDGSQDPYTWITEFERAAQANHWENDRKLKLASVYLKGIALISTNPYSQLQMLTMMPHTRITASNIFFLLDLAQPNRKHSGKNNFSIL